MPDVPHAPSTEGDLGDETLFQDLRVHWAERDPVPAGMLVRMQATAALAASDTDLDLELMTLVERTGELAGARGARRSAGSAYTLRFAHDGLDLLVRVDPGVGSTGHGGRGETGPGGTGRGGHTGSRQGDDGSITGVGPGAEGGARIDCWLVPPTPARVRVLLGADPQSADGPTVEVSASGRFEVSGLPSGLMRLRLEPDDPDTPVFVTPAFEI